MDYSPSVLRAVSEAFRSSPLEVVMVLGGLALVLGVLTAFLLRQKKKLRQIVEASSPESSVKVLIVPTDEELAIARDTYSIVMGRG